MSKKVGAVSSETKENILKAARAEFLENGFQGSSLRRICAEAGVTTGAVYFFFDGKNDLFETILSDITIPFMNHMKAHYESEHEFLNKSADDNEDEDFQTGRILIDFYFKNRDTWDILLNNLGHPYVSGFINDFIDYSTEHYIYLISLADRVHARKNPVDNFAIHQYVHLQVDTMLTLVSHDFPYDEMLKHCRTVTRMLRGAFNALLED